MTLFLLFFFFYFLHLAKYRLFLLYSKFSYFCSIYDPHDNYGFPLREKVGRGSLKEGLYKLNNSYNLPSELKAKGNLLSNLVGVPYLDRLIIQGVDLVNYIDLDFIDSLEDLSLLLHSSEDFSNLVICFSSVSKVFPVYLDYDFDYGFPVDFKLDSLFIVKDTFLVKGRVFYSRKRWHRFFTMSHRNSVNAKVNNYKYLWRDYLLVVLLRKLGRSRGFRKLELLNLFNILSKNLGRAFWYFNHTNGETSIINVLALAHSIKFIINPLDGMVEEIIFDWPLYLGFIKYYSHGFSTQTNTSISNFIEEILIINEETHPCLSFQDF